MFAIFFRENKIKKKREENIIMDFSFHKFDVHCNQSHWADY